MPFDPKLRKTLVVFVLGMFVFVVVLTGALGWAVRAQGFYVPENPSVVVADTLGFQLPREYSGIHRTTEPVDSWYHIPLQNAEAHHIVFEAGSEPIQIVMARWKSSNEAARFWNAFMQKAVGSFRRHSLINNVSEPYFITGQYDDRYDIAAWHAKEWFFYIGVPVGISNHDTVKSALKDSIIQTLKKADASR